MSPADVRQRSEPLAWRRHFRILLILLALIGAALAAWIGLVVVRGPDKFTMIVLPDTQYYAESHPDVLQDQFDWILREAEPRNIVFVMQAGDLVEHYDAEPEWQRIDEAFARLDGILPYSVLPGNHDMSPARDTTEFDQRFPPARFIAEPWYGGNFPESSFANSYALVTAGGYDFGLFRVSADRFVIVSLQFCPTAEAVEWAKAVLAEHSDRHAILITHAYLNVHGQRHVNQPSGGCTDPTQNTAYLFDTLVYPNPNVFLVLSGHEYDTQDLDGEAMREDLNRAGLPVYQFTADFQRRPDGGSGWLRILGFNRELGQLIVRTYSPSLGSYEKDEDSDFVLPYPELPPG